MTHLPEIICWALLHFLWQATAITGIYKCIEYCLPGTAARQRYALALGALIAMFAAAAGTAAYETVRSAHNYSQVAEESGVRLLAGKWLDSAIILRNAGRGAAFWIDAFWSVGVLLMSVRALGGIWLLARLRTSSSLPAPESLVRQVESLRSKMRICRSVAVRVHNGIASPFVAGALRPIIYVPLCFLSGLTPDQIRMVLAHELAHVARADYIWNIFQIGMETLFFFHPAVWWIGRVLREDRENSCDDMVLEAFAGPVVYAHALLAMAENGAGVSRFALGLRGGKSGMQLLPRVARILGASASDQQRVGSGALLKLSVPAVAGVALLCCTVAAPVASLTLPPTVEAFSQNSTPSRVREIDVPVRGRAIQEARASASHASSLASRVSSDSAAASAGKSDSLADGMAPGRASSEFKRYTTSKGPSHSAEAWVSSPLVVRTGASTVNASGTPLDSQALAEQAIPSAIAEQLRLHPELRLDRRRTTSSDRDVGPGSDPHNR